MGQRSKAVAMTWEEAPDTIGVDELMSILQIGKNHAGKLFNSKGFPKIEGIGSSLRADKEAVKLYLQGFKIKENSKSAMEYRYC